MLKDTRKREKERHSVRDTVGIRASATYRRERNGIPDLGTWNLVIPHGTFGVGVSVGARI